MKIPGWVKGSLVGIYFVLLAILFTYPLITMMSTRIIGQPGDNIYYAWVIGWVKKAIFDLQVNPLNVWFLNYPEGWNLAYTEIAPVQVLIALPFALLVNPLFGYNFSMLSTYVLAGVFMFLWTKSLTGKTGVALIAGTAFATLPFHQAHFLAGHLNIAGIQWFPLYFWGLFEIIKSEPVKQRVKFSLIAGAALGLIGLTSMYYLYMTALVTLVILVINLFFVRKRVFKWQYWSSFLWMGLLTLPLIALALWPFLALENQVSMPARDISVARMLAASASPLDYILPSTDHFAVGSWVNQHFNRQMWIENTLYMGFIPLIFAVIGGIALKKTNKRLIHLILSAILFAWILSLGLDLFLDGERLQIQMPGFLANLFNRTEAYIPLPGLLLYKYLPFYDRMRSFARFGVFVMLFVQVLMAFGLSFTWENIRSQAGRAVLTFLLLLAVVAEFYPGIYDRTFSAEGRPVDAWLAQQDDAGAVIQFPFDQVENQDLVYATLTNGKPFVGGAFSSFPPQQYQSIKPVMQNFPDAASVELLDQLGVTYVLADANHYTNDAELISACETLGLEYIDTMGEELVFINMKE
ncbi:MAG TPA: hypothetical protein PK174_01710 [Anaerolineaceae bacterium]|nr:hypothetical protein [Anaerolineaceae bacterium]